MGVGGARGSRVPAERRAFVGSRLGLVVVAWALLVGQGPAAPDRDPPWNEERARVDSELEAVVAAGVGMPDPRFGRFSVQKRAARRAARRRALELIHRFVDDQLARAAARPAEAQSVHTAVDRAARVLVVRPLVDGGAVVVVRVPLDALRGAVEPLRGVAWRP